MTVKELLKNVAIDSFNFNFDDQFDAYNALCDSSKKIKMIVDTYLEDNSLDWEDIFKDKVDFDYRKNFISQLYSKYDDIDTNILYSKLVVDSIYDDRGMIMLDVHYEG